jgi:hypothetical protein
MNAQQQTFIASVSERGSVSLREFAKAADQKARGHLFDGQTLDDRDTPRLKRQLDGVLRALKTGGWWTLSRLAEEAGGSEAGVSARIRDLRKLRWGAHTIDRRRLPGGLYQYQLAEKAESEAA